MKLIIDSGSTKTDWIALDAQNDVLFETQTQGLNPQVLSDAILEERIINNYDLYRKRKSVNYIHFYGAGCGTKPPRVLLKKVLQSIFPSAKIAAIGPCPKNAYNALFSRLCCGINSCIGIFLYFYFSTRENTL